MASRTQGITIEIGGNTTGLNKALDGTNKQIGTTQKELKDVERLLKLDPTNTTLLEQKHRLLATSVGDTKAKLDTLKTAEKQVQEQFLQGKVSQQQYDNLQREIVATEQQLKNLETQAEKSNVVLSQIGKAADGIGAGARNVAGAMTPATLAIGGLGVIAFKSASDVEESQNKVNVAFKDSAKEVSKFADNTLKSFGIAKGTALDMASLYGDMGTSMGQSTDEASKMSTSLVGLAGDLSSFKNISLETSQNALKGIFTGETESLKNLGVVMTQTNLDNFAMANGFEKTTKDMTEAEKVNLRYQYVMNATANAQGDFARTSDGAANSTRVAQESLKELSAEFGEVLLPAITPIIQMISELIQWFTQLDDGTKTTIVVVLAMVAAIAPVAGLISGISTVISGLSAALMFLAANPIILVIAAIVAFVVAIALWGDEIQAVLQKVDDFLQGVFATDWKEMFGPILGEYLNAFFKNFENIWNAIKRIFDGVIDFIRGVFTGDWERAWKGVQNIFGGIFDYMVSMAKAPLNGIIGLLNIAVNCINELIIGFNNIGFTMPDWLGGGSFNFNIPKIPNIPYLAKGGIMSNGSAIVGEAGPELLTVLGNKTMVQPLTSQSKITNTSTTGKIVVNVFGAEGQSEYALAERVAEKIKNITQRKEAVYE